MEWIFVAIVGLLAIGLAIATGWALDRERQLNAARAALLRRGTDGQTDEDLDADLSTLARRLRDRLTASEFELDQQVRNVAYLADLMGVGIVRLTDDGRVEFANAAAHLLLHRPPASLRGGRREAFVDARVEDLVAAARQGGGASGEFRLSGPDGRSSSCGPGAPHRTVSGSFSRTSRSSAASSRSGPSSSTTCRTSCGLR